jgi:UDP-glucose 4-epimerase
MSIENKSIMVTGAAGFIGSHLVDKLITENPGDLIVVIDNFYLGNRNNLKDAITAYPDLKICQCDAGNYTSMKEIMKNENIDVVFNLAVLPLPASLTQPKWVCEQNMNIALCVSELAREGYYDTLIHFSSSEAYGTCEYAPMDEKHPLNPTTPYAASKVASDYIILSYYRTFGIDCSIIRPFNNIGERQNAKKHAGVIPLTVNRILRGEPPMIYGSGDQTRDYIYVGDTTRAAIDIYNNNSTRGKILNIGTGKEVSIAYIVKRISEIMGYKGEISHLSERPGDIERHVADISLAKRLINFEPTVTFDEAIDRTVRYYLDNAFEVLGLEK